MIGELLAWVASERERQRLSRKRQRKFRKWLTEHTDGSYAQFYAEETRRHIDKGGFHPTLGVDTVDQVGVKARAQRILGHFKRAGCQPHHAVVDYGCGSLWVGEAFMAYLDPGNYIGLDVADAFFTEGLARLPASFVAERKPMMRVISDEVLRDVRERKPDFILCAAVLLHVPPEDLAGFFERVLSLAGPQTRIEINHNPLRFRSRWVPPRLWQHSRRAINRALANSGYVAVFDPQYRIMKTTPGMALVRK